MDMEIVFSGGKKVEALFKGFRIKTDQSKKHGGEALFPAPFDLFLASLGTCSGIYVLNFCQERNIPADKIKLVLVTQKEPPSRMIKKIEIEIRLPSDFPVKYKAALVRAAELCTVTKHLYDPPKMLVEAKFRDEV